MKDYLKKITLLIVINYIDLSISAWLYDFFVILPLTFLTYSFYAYKTNKTISPIEAFMTGLIVDLISDSYFGLNIILFCLITYLINLYSNSFKIFSYLQVCLFFGFSATAYIGFTQLVLNLYNFSYLMLFASAVFNISFCIIIALISSYFPKVSRLKI
ncbi:MAG: rod shape-determining protein MreD [Gammaproteobacteria bacterium]